MTFKLRAPYKPAGDQPQAIDQIIRNFESGKNFNTLLGVTGSGKTFTAANIIAHLNKPTLVISHNKTLVAQLYSELRDLFPENAVEYFVSYYDYYQPEAYLPQTDTFIEKDSAINDDIDRLRLRATSSLLSRKDCIIVSSVSCIYGLGSPSDYAALLVILKRGMNLDRENLLKRLIDIQYERNDIGFKRATFRVKGDTVDIYLAYEETAIRVYFDFDTVTRLERIDPVTSHRIHELDSIAVYPAKHFVTTQQKIDESVVTIETELKAQLEKFQGEHKLVEAQRLEQRTKYDLEMLKNLGYCSGIENYSRHLSGRQPGSRPYCLFDYFPEDFLLIIDESHVSIPQISGMSKGDRARKETLVQYGFRLPSALDNRPLKFDEFESMIRDTLCISATPSEYEVRRCGGVVSQIIRPTGLLDPSVEIRPSQGQVDHLIEEIQKRAKRHERTLVTTLTKRMSEELCRYFKDVGLKAQYLHSEIDTIERVEILKNLRQNEYDCLVGINLLREGLDLPEVSLVAILDADKEGFLRSTTSLIQTAGRAARHVNGHAILYADIRTRSMERMIEQTNRRRRIQISYNKKNHIKPIGISKDIRDGIEAIKKVRQVLVEATGLDEDGFESKNIITELEQRMEKAARNLHFEKAIELRDRIRQLREPETSK